MSIIYSDGDEMRVREVSQDAPQAFNRLSAGGAPSSIDGELRRHYSVRSSQWFVSPNELDSDKEVVSGLPMDSGEGTRNRPTSSSTRRVVSPIPTMVALGPETSWRQDMGHVASESPRTVSFGGKAISDNSGGEEDTNRDRDGAQSAHPSSTNEKGKIMGMRRHVFWAVMTILGLLVVIAAVAGGLGSSLASKADDSASTLPSANDTSSTSSAPTHSISGTPTTSTSSTPTLTRTALTSSIDTPTPTPAGKTEFLHNQTWPRTDLLAFQGFSRPGFSGMASRIYVGDGSKAFAANFMFDVHSFAWVPNFHNCCVNLCSNATLTGRVALLCGQAPKKEAVTPGTVTRAVVWCDDGQDGGASKDRGCGPIT
ncbi:hypothetical protein E4U53_003562 [Claviceps sorghi]|nr:hypothetical protein E4U53_003562 [Claviceps sorghi]